MHPDCETTTTIISALWIGRNSISIEKCGFLNNAMNQLRGFPPSSCLKICNRQENGVFHYESKVSDAKRLLIILNEERDPESNNTGCGDLEFADDLSLITYFYITNA